VQETTSPSLVPFSPFLPLFSPRQKILDLPSSRRPFCAGDDRKVHGGDASGPPGSADPFELPDSPGRYPGQGKWGSQTAKRTLGGGKGAARRQGTRAVRPCPSPQQEPGNPTPTDAARGEPTRQGGSCGTLYWQSESNNNARGEKSNNTAPSERQFGFGLAEFGSQSDPRNLQRCDQPVKSRLALM